MFYVLRVSWLGLCVLALTPSRYARRPSLPILGEGDDEALPFLAQTWEKKGLGVDEGLPPILQRERLCPGIVA